MPANCGVATVIRATQVSPLRFGMFVRDIAADGPVGRVVRMCRCGGYSRGDGRRGAIYDARCRHGTTRPRHCSRRCTRCFRPIAALRRLSGRHKCRPYVWRRYPAALRRPARGDGRRGAIYDARCRNGTTRPRRCSRRCARCFRSIAVLCRPARGDGRRGAIYDARCRHGTTRPRHCAMRCARCFRPIAALRRFSGRHKCRPYVLAAAFRGVATVFRATQVSPLRFGGGILRRCDGYPGDTSVAPTFGGGILRRCVGIPGDTSVAPTLGGVCGGHVVCRRVETVGRLVFPVAVTVFPDGRSLLLVTTSVNAHRLMDFRGGEETFCSTKLD